MIGKYDIIKSDLFDIGRRIREIDGDYFIVYNYKKRRYEIHNRGQGGGTLCLVVPYNRLDARTITLVLSTRRERSVMLFEQMERENAAIYNNEMRIASKKAEFELEDALRRVRK